MCFWHLEGFTSFLLHLLLRNFLAFWKVLLMPEPLEMLYIGNLSWQALLLNHQEHRNEEYASV